MGGIVVYWLYFQESPFASPGPLTLHLLSIIYYRIQVLPNITGFVYLLFCFALTKKWCGLLLKVGFGKNRLMATLTWRWAWQSVKIKVDFPFNTAALICFLHSQMNALIFILSRTMIFIFDSRNWWSLFPWFAWLGWFIAAFSSSPLQASPQLQILDYY